MSTCCTTLARKFDADYVTRALALREKQKPGPTAPRMVALLASEEGDGFQIQGASLLDIGAGLGDLETALFARGLGSATHVEASEAYSAAARKIACREGWEDRVRFRVGDFIELSDGLHEADIVTLDRVVCCYPDMPGLVDRAAHCTRHLCAVSAPRDRWWVRAFIGLENLVRRLRRDPFRTFVHSWAAMDARLAARGLERIGEGGTRIWRVVVYRRGRQR